MLSYIDLETRNADVKFAGENMGIVVTIAMLLGLVILRPTPWNNTHSEKQDLRVVTFTSASLALFGLWNVAWYGFRHFDQFWGWTAIISGLSMIFAAIIIMVERTNQNTSTGTWLAAIRGFVVAVLASSFILYAVTLVQLNLGLPIVGR